MGNEQVLFDAEWRDVALKCEDQDSWAYNVIEEMRTTGQSYLSKVESWFNDIHYSVKGKINLGAALKSLSNNDHLGAVNELAWWAFLRKEEFQGACK